MWGWCLWCTSKVVEYSPPQSSSDIEVEVKGDGDGDGDGDCANVKPEDTSSRRLNLSSL